MGQTNFLAVLLRLQSKSVTPASHRIASTPTCVPALRACAARVCESNGEKNGDAPAAARWKATITTPAAALHRPPSGGEAGGLAEGGHDLRVRWMKLLPTCWMSERAAHAGGMMTLAKVSLLSLLTALTWRPSSSSVRHGAMADSTQHAARLPKCSASVAQCVCHGRPAAMRAVSSCMMMMCVTRREERDLRPRLTTIANVAIDFRCDRHRHRRSFRADVCNAQVAVAVIAIPAPPLPQLIQSCRRAPTSSQSPGILIIPVSPCWHLSPRKAASKLTMCFSLLYLTPNELLPDHRNARRSERRQCLSYAHHAHLCAA